jgi:hypothetical protein
MNRLTFHTRLSHMFGAFELDSSFVSAPRAGISNVSRPSLDFPPDSTDFKLFETTSET